MKIPNQPVPPFPQKPTKPIAVTREEYIRNSVNKDLGYFERKKIEKEVGEQYDTQITDYEQKRALWEQWEKECTEWQKTYGETVDVQVIAERQALTEHQQEARDKDIDKRIQQMQEELIRRENQIKEREQRVKQEIEQGVQRELEKLNQEIEQKKKKSEKLDKEIDKKIDAIESLDVTVWANKDFLQRAERNRQDFIREIEKRKKNRER